jgi:chemotaxis signal transduction protein
MSNSLSSAAAGAADMRRAFDSAFADPVRFDTTATESLLAIRAGTQACAIRLSEVTGLFADKKITRVPGSVATLLGIAGFRGAILPVYSLQLLLGQSGDPAGARTPRWLVVAASAPVALTFEAFEGQLRVLPDAILPRQSRPEMKSYAREFVQVQTVVRPIVHLPSVLDAIKAPKAEAAPRKAEAAPRKEQ